MRSLPALGWLKNMGIEKTVFGHDFVYRFPESREMPLLDVEKLALELRGMRGNVALYVHIPFCSKKCNFCHYYKESVPSNETVEKYVLALKRELAAYKEVLHRSVRVQSVFFGGGTPTLLRASQLTGLLDFLCECFPLRSKTEVSIESSPETLSLEKLTALRECGFNRLSVGVQDFNSGVLRASNRAHSPRQAKEAIALARKAGFENINIDLIYGLPFQGLGQWEKTLNETRALELESVTASDLRVQENTVFFSWKQKLFPSVEEMRKMYYRFVECFLSEGFVQQFPYQFTRKGCEMEFLENQWSGGQFVGVGASSCSFVGGWDYNNAMPLQRYFQAIEEHCVGAVVGKKLSLEEQMKRFVGLGLKKSGLNRKKRGVSKSKFKELFGVPLTKAFSEWLGEMKSAFLVEENGDRVWLSFCGLFFHDEVARRLFQLTLNRH